MRAWVAYKFAKLPPPIFHPEWNVAKILKVNFDSANSSAQIPQGDAPPEVVNVELHSAALTLERWKDFDQVVFDLSAIDGEKKANFCKQLIAGQSLMDQVPDGLALLDVNGKILWANARLTKWFQNETLVGLDFYGALGKPTICGTISNPLESAARQRKTSVATLRTEDKYFRLNVAPIANASMEVELLVVTLVDTTQSSLEKKRLKALYEASMALADLTPREIFEMEIDQRIELLKENILYYTQHLLDFDVVEIRLVDANTGLLETLLSTGIDSAISKRPLYAKRTNNGVTGFVAATGQSYLCEDTTDDPLYLDGLVGAKSSLTVPLIYNDKVIGSFNVESPEVGAFTENDLEVVTSFARGVAVSLNTLELLVAEKNNSAQQSVDAIHSAVALPIDVILNDTVSVIERYIGHDPAVVKRLRGILKNARDIKNVIQKVGETMVPAEAVPAGIHVVRRPALRGKRVLVIDADEQVRTSAHQLLERYGCVVETAQAGVEAILMMRNCDPDSTYHAIISDIRMPDLTGYELLVKLKELYKEPPLILMTGFGYDPGHTIVKARQAGLRAGGILYKPFRLDQLLETVEATITSSERPAVEPRIDSAS